MPKTYIFEGSTTNEAIEKGLKELNLSKNQVNIRTLEENKKSFFSILSPRIVRVEFTIKESINVKNEEKNAVLNDESIESQISIISSFLSDFISKLPSTNIKYNIEYVNETIKIFINGDDIGYLIGNRGETIKSLQYILAVISNKKLHKGANIVLDIDNYKQKKEVYLKELANRMADIVKKQRKTITLKPMNAYERRIIHTELQNSDEIETYSTGKDPYRKVVISLKK